MSSFKHGLRSRRRNFSQLLALEPRLLFDGAALASTDAAVDKPTHATAAPIPVAEAQVSPLADQGQPVDTAPLASASTPERSAPDSVFRVAPANPTVAQASQAQPIETAQVSADASTLLERAAAALPPATDSPITQVVFVDTAVKDYQTLVNGIVTATDTNIADVNPTGALGGVPYTISGNTLIVTLGSQPLADISSVLRHYQNLDALHIVSHGDIGELVLGTTRITAANLSQYQDQIAGWGQSLAANGDLLLYGCKVAADGTGQQFIDQVAALTQADVNASNDNTGNISSGGDWDLEVNTGPIEAAVLLNEQNAGTWKGNLATYTASAVLADEGTGIYKKDILWLGLPTNLTATGIVAGDIYNYTLTDGSRLELTINSVTNGHLISAKDMDTWSGSKLWKMYQSTASATEAWYSNFMNSVVINIGFKVYNNPGDILSTTKPTIVFADAEETDSTGLESVKGVTSGQDWQYIEGNGGTGSSVSTKTVTYTNTTSGLSIYASKEVSTLTVTLTGGNSRQGFALGIVQISAQDDTFTTPVNTPVTITPLTNDSNPLGLTDTIVVKVDGQSITSGGTITLADGTGTVRLNADKTLTYTPTTGYIGAPKFQYTIKDSSNILAPESTAWITGQITGDPLIQPYVDLNSTYTSTSSALDTNTFVRNSTINNSQFFDQSAAPLYWTENTTTLGTGTTGRYVWAPAADVNSAAGHTLTQAVTLPNDQSLTTQSISNGQLTIQRKDTEYSLGKITFDMAWQNSDTSTAPNSNTFNVLYGGTVVATFDTATGAWTGVNGSSSSVASVTSVTNATTGTMTTVTLTLNAPLAVDVSADSGFNASGNLEFRFGGASQGRDTLAIDNIKLETRISTITTTTVVDIANSLSPVTVNVDRYATYTEGSAAVSIADTATSESTHTGNLTGPAAVFDGNNNNIQSGIIAIANFQTGDRLVTLSGWTATADPTKFTMTSGGQTITATLNNTSTASSIALSGVASTTLYATALKSIGYENTSETPSSVVRDITVQVTDTTSLSSNTAHAYITVKAVNIVSVSDESQTEGSDLVHTVTLSNPLQGDKVRTIQLALTGNTATIGGSGSDIKTLPGAFQYSTDGGVTWINVPSNGQITVAATSTNTPNIVLGSGNTFKVRVQSFDDTLYEGGSASAGETYKISAQLLKLTSTGSDETAVEGIGTIEDNDTAPIASIVVAPSSVTEDGTDTLVYTVTLDKTSATDTVINLTTSGTATSGTDYTGAATTLTIAAGETSGKVTIDPSSDLIYEGDETVKVALAAGTGYAVTSNTALASATGTITDAADLPVATIAVDPASVTEDGVTNLVYTVTLDHASATDTVINLTTSGTATSGTDYTGSATTLTIAAGETSGKVTIDPSSDLIYEGDETVNIALATGTGYAVTSNTAQASATGTITDAADLPVATIAVDPASVTEDGVTNLVYTVTLDHASATDTVINLTTSGTATSGTDYTGSATTLTIAAGETSGKVTIDPSSDLIYEGDETVNIALATGTGYAVTSNTAQASATGTITDAADLPVATIAVDPASVTEDGVTNLVYTVTLDHASATDTVINLTTSGTATSGTDYTGSATTLTILAGQTSGKVTIDPTSDLIYEGDETVNIALATGTGYAVTSNTALASATGTITDAADLPVATIAVDPASVTEDGVTNLVYTVTLDHASATDTVINLTTSGTATSGTDYTGAATTLTIAAGETSGKVTIDPSSDLIYEGDETVKVALATGTGYAVTSNTALASATGTITDAADLPVATIAVAPASVTEDGTTNLVYTVTLDHASATDTVVNLMTSGTATSADYTGAVTTLTIAAGQTSGMVTIDPSSDLIYEGDETVKVALAAGTGYAVTSDTAKASATGTITNDDAAPVFSIANASIAEGGLMTFTVTRTGDAQMAQTVDYATSIGSGNTAATNDFTAASGTVSFATGETSKTFTVQTTADAVYEADETFTATLSNATGGATVSATAGTATGTITNDDAAPVFSIANASIAEGGLMTFTVTRTGDAQMAQTVDYATSIGSGNTAATNDFTAASGTVSFATGETSKTFTVQTTADTVYEADETFTATLSNATGGATVSATAGTATGTITNDDAAPVFSIANASIAEGGLMTFTVTRTGDAQMAQTVDYATSIGSGNTAATNDFTAASGTVSFATGETSKTFTVQTTADTVYEADETFTATLSNATGGATVSATAGTATGTITNDDAAPVFSIANASIAEGGLMTFTVTRTGDAQMAQTVDYATSIGSGNTAATNDFTAASGTVSFAAGEVSKTFTVQTTADAVYEADETFTATLSNATGGATVSATAGTATGTITNDDAAPVFSIANASIAEGGLMTFTVTRTGDAQMAQTVDYATSIGSGNTAATNDFTAASGTVSFATGETSKTFTVQTTADTVYEADETFTATLSNATGGATVSATAGTATGTITDTTALTVSIGDATTVNEGGNLVYTVTLSGTSTTAITIPVTYTGTAADGSDYTSVATVTIPAGSTSGTLTIPTSTDSIVEGPETVIATLGTPTGAPAGAPAITVTDGEATGTLTDTTALTVSIGDAPTVNEGGNLVYTVTLSGTSTTAITIPVTYTGTAADGSDYTSVATVTIPAGSVTGTLTIPTSTDSIVEGPETVIATLGTPTGAPAGAPAITVTDGEATGTLTDTTALTVSIGDAPTVNEGGNLVYTVTLSGTSTTAITIPVTYTGTAADGSDYTSVATVTIPAGSTSGTLTIPTSTDSIVEGPETVIATLGTPTGAPAGAPAITVTDGEATGTLTDTTALTVSIGDAPTVNEGGNLVYTVTLSGTSTTAITIPVTYTGTAADGSDYTSVATVTIPAGSVTGTLTIPTSTDSIVEGPETVIATLGTPTGAPAGAPAITVTDGEATGTLTDTTALTVSIGDAPTVNEGGNLVYTVTLSGTSTTAITIPVTYTGTAADGSDYTSVATVTIPAGSTSGTLTIPTSTDSIVEGPETVIATLGTPTGAPAGAPAITVTDGEATGTLTDTTALTVSIGDAPTVNEGGNLVYTVTLSGTSTTAITIPVTYTGTAADGSDYTSVATVTIPAGSVTGTLTIPTSTDSIVEGPETVIATLGTPTGAPAGAPAITVTDGEATGTLTDTTALTVSIGDAPTVNEGGNLVYTVTLSGTSTTAITIPVTYTGTAADGSDYTSVATVTIPAGSVTGTLTIPTSTDSIVEGPETVIATLGTPTGAPAGAPAITVTDGEATGTLTDTTALTVSIGDAPTVNEGGNLVYTVTLSGTSTTAITIPVTYTGTAADGSDYTSVATVTIPAGSTSGTLTIPTSTDSIVEGPETVIATLGTPTGAPAGAPAITVSDGSATGTITDSNHAPVATDNTVSTPAGTLVSGNVITDNSGAGVDSDPEGTALTVTQFTVDVNGDGLPETFAAGTTATIPTVGTLVINADGSYSFTPVDGFVGTVPPVRYTVSDGQSVSNPAALTLTVTQGTQTPSVVADSITTPEDSAVLINVLGNDAPGSAGPLTITHVNGNPITATTPVTLTDPATGAVLGTVAWVNNQLEFTPAPNVNGPVNFEYTVQDTAGTALTAPVAVTVTPVNDAPVAQADSTSTLAGQPVTINVLDNDQDVDGDPLTITAINGQSITATTPVTVTDPTTGAVIGTVALNNGGTPTDPTDDQLVFTPAAGYTGPATFNYTVTDPSGVSSSPATVTVNVGATNQVPQAQPDTGTTNEDTVLTVPAATGVLANDSDPNGDSLTVSEVNGQASSVGTPVTGTHGTLTLNADGSYRYAPNAAAQALKAGEQVTESFNYTVTDPTGAKVTTTLTLTVTGQNDAPVAVNDQTVTLPNTLVSGNVLTNDTDVDGDSLTVTQFVVNGTPYTAGQTATLPNVGTLVINPNGEYTFTPVAGYQGLVPLATYTVTDGTTTATATLQVTVTATNHAPVANDDTITGQEDQPVTFNPLTNDQDADGNPLTITAINDQPVTVGTPLPITDPTTGNPVGSLTLNPDGTLTFTPVPNFNGSVPPISYTVSDGQGTNSTANGTIHLQVSAVNDAPVATDNTVSTPAGTLVSGNVITDNSGAGVDSDPEGTALTVTQFTVDVNGDGLPETFAAGTTATIPTVGTLVINADGSYSFTPVDGFVGTVPPVRYTVSDGQSVSNPAALTLTVTQGTQTPSVVADSITTPEDSAVLINVLGNDAPGSAGPLTITHVNGNPITATTPVTLTDPATGAVLGTVAWVNNQLEFTPAPNVNGPVNFEYTVQDTAGTALTAPVAVTVTPVNDAPVAQADSTSTLAGQPVTINVLDNDQDVDGDPLTITAINGQSITATTPVTVTDPTTGAVIGTVALNNGGTPTDPTDDQLVFTPAAGYTGPATFNYTVTDPSGVSSSPATVTVNVGATNQVPQAQPDTGTTNEDTVLTVPAATGVLANDSDPNGDSLTVSEVNGQASSVGTPVTGTHGTLTLNADGSYRYAPNAAAQALKAGEQVTESFNYTVTDPTGAKVTTTLTLTVTGQNDAPVAVNDQTVTLPNTLVSGNVLTNDTDVDGDSLTVTQFVVNGTPYTAGQTATLPNVGTLVINPNGEYTFTPVAGYQGLVPLATYTVTDGTTTATATLQVTVTATNHAPVANDDTITGQEDQPVTFNPLTNDQDADGNPLTITAINDQPVTVGTPLPITDPTTGNPVGSLTLNPDGTLTFTPVPNFNGSVPPISYTVSDGQGSNSTANGTIHLQVSAVNDAPVATDNTVSTPAGTLVSGNVLADDTDPDGDPLAVTEATVDTNGDGTPDNLPLNTPTAITNSSGQPIGTLTVNGNGDYTFMPAPNYSGPVPPVTVTVSDGHGGTDTSTLALTVVDTTPPKLTVNAPDGTNDPTPTITGTTDLPPGSPVTVTVTDSAGKTQTLTTTVKPDGTFSVDVPTPVADGPYTATATAKDPAGNSTTVSDPGSVDTTPPKLTVNAPDGTNDPTPTITGTTDLPPGNPVTVTVTDSTGKTQTLTTTVKPDGTFSVDVPTPVADGPYTATATAKDPAGNSTTVSDPGSVDTTPPKLTVNAPDGTNDPTPTITGTTDLPPGNPVTVTVTDSTGKTQTLTTTVKPDGTFSVDVPTPVADGPYTATATAKDPAGNSTTVSDPGSVDTTPPKLTVNAPDGTNDPTPTITGTTDLPPGNPVTVTVTDSTGKTQTLTTTVKPDGTFSVDVPTPVADGPYTATATAKDPAGNSTTVSDPGSVDTTPPKLTVNAPDGTNDPTPTITGTTDLPPGSPVTVTVTDSAGKTQTLTTTVKPDGTFSVDVPTPVADGPYTVTATGTDPAGNSTTVNDPGSVDTTPPKLTVNSPDGTNDSTPTITGTTDLPPGSPVTVTVIDRVGKVQTLTATVKADGTFSVEVTTPLAPGHYTATVTATDAAGNTATATDPGRVHPPFPVEPPGPYFEGRVASQVIYPIIPFEPGLFIVPTIDVTQNEQALADAALGMLPANMHRVLTFGPYPRTAGLGMVPGLFVTNAVRESFQERELSDLRVSSDAFRADLSADGFFLDGTALGRMGAERIGPVAGRSGHAPTAREKAKLKRRAAAEGPSIQETSPEKAPVETSTNAARVEAATAERLAMSVVSVRPEQGEGSADTKAPARAAPTFSEQLRQAGQRANQNDAVLRVAQRRH